MKISAFVITFFFSLAIFAQTVQCENLTHTEIRLSLVQTPMGTLLVSMQGHQFPLFYQGPSHSEDFPTALYRGTLSMDDREETVNAFIEDSVLSSGQGRLNLEFKEIFKSFDGTYSCY